MHKIRSDNSDTKSTKKIFVKLQEEFEDTKGDNQNL